MDKLEKRVFWQKHLDNWSDSDLSQKAYCAQHDLKLANFNYWRKQLSTKEVTSSKFIPVALSSPSSVRLTVSGIQMEVPVEILEQVLPVIWRSVREAG